MGEDHDNAKIALRRELTARRSLLSAREVGRRSRAICAHVLASPRFMAARQVVLYRSIGNEVDATPLEQRAVALGKRVYLPAPGAPAFAALEGGVLLDASLPDTLLIIPGVAFDRRGVRLGRGGGWYDRALSVLGPAYRIGLAFDFQVVSELPATPLDQRMHAVVTETGPISLDGTANGQMKEITI